MKLTLTTAAILALLLAPPTARAQAPTVLYEAGRATPAQVRVHAQIFLLDAVETRRAGLGYVQVGNGRLQPLAGPRGRRGGITVGGDAGGISVSAFIDLARDRRVLRSDTRTQVLAMSGSPAMIGSGTLQAGGWRGSRVRGPQLMVIPTVLPDGRVRLDVRARIRDEYTGPYHSVDGSPLDAATTVVVEAGKDATVGSLQTRTAESDAGFLSWRDVSTEREILVVLRPEIVD